MAELRRKEFQAAVDYVLSFADYERLSRSAVVFDLTRVEALLERLGQPHLAARSVHIAGTKGKGSTAAMIASVLTASGYRTGLYTSPHLLSITERLQVDNEPISEPDFATLVQRLKPEIEAVNRLGELGELTTFEILTALAFAYFKDRGADFQVMEVGLGGRLDATNVVKPEVCAIASISMDHTEVLGDSLAQIAREKAGIIKPGVAVVCAPQPPEATAVIEEVCQQKRARLIMVGKDITWRAGQFGDSGQSFRIKGTRGEYNLTVPLLGEHQLENAAVAVACLEVLGASGASVSSEDIAAGMSRVCWPGRLQIMQRSPLFVVDGAHNAESAAMLRRSLEHYFDFEDAILIIGVSQDKNIAGIVAELSPISGKVIVTRSGHPRGAPATALAAEFSRWGTNPEVAEDTASAIATALARAKPGDLICATGSLFIVAEAMEYFGGPPSTSQ